MSESASEGGERNSFLWPRSRRLASGSTGLGCRQALLGPPPALAWRWTAKSLHCRVPIVDMPTAHIGSLSFSTRSTLSVGTSRLRSTPHER